MGKYVNPQVLDNALNEIAEANLMIAIAGQPADFAAAQAGKLVEVAMAPGDFTLAAGTVSGRQISTAEKANVDVLAAGTADHVALLDTVGSRLLYVTTVDTPQPVVTPGQVTFQSWAVEIGAPA